MAGVMFGSSALGAGFTLAAAAYQMSAGFAGRHEAAHAQQTEITKRHIAEFEEQYKRGEVSEIDWMQYMLFRDEARCKEKVYEDNINTFKKTSNFNLVKKWKLKRKVRKSKMELWQSNRSLRSHYDDCSSGASDTSSTSAAHGSPPRSAAANSAEDVKQISTWANDVSASQPEDKTLEQDRQRLGDLESESEDEIPQPDLRCFHVIRTKSYRESLSFSPDGRRIVSGSSDAQIHIWSVPSRRVSVGPLRGHKSSINSVAFSPNGMNIVSGSWDQTLRIWDAWSGKCTAGPLTGHSDYISCVAFSPNGQMVVSGSDDKKIRIWDVQTGAIIGEPLTGHTDQVLSVSFSPDNKYIISSCKDCTIRIWEATTGITAVWPFKSGINTISLCAVFNPDGKRIISVSGEGSIYSWCSKTGEIISSHSKIIRSSPSCLFISQDSNFVVSESSRNTLAITDVSTGESIANPLKGHWDAVICVAVSPDGSRVATGSLDCTLRIWNVDACRQRYLLTEASPSSKDIYIPVIGAT